jgi:hydrogenase maturation protein HypF
MQKIFISISWSNAPMKLVIHGIVQGVGFRPTVHRIARSLNLRGYVQNNGSNVVVEIDGDGDEFLRELEEGLPPLARIDRIERQVSVAKALDGIEGFIIVPSKEGQKGIGIPNDVALCDTCRRELFDPSNRRYLYPFTNCTDCGARFTVIEDLPYDRSKTSMREFPMCQTCRDEYSDPDNRRFHHQTISCPQCGPRYQLLDRNGNEIGNDPIADFAARIDEGEIGVAKSWGGMHICCSMEAIPRLREWYGRKHKPFAIMIRDLEALEAHGFPTDHEIQLLTSPHRPVTLVAKNHSEGMDWASPGLNNIGVFLPYTAMHEILFHHLDADAMVMTSANVPGEPMMLDDRDVLSLGADSYLLHDRRVVNRCDDSVVRSFDESTHFIRRSRGHIPSSIESPFRGRAIGIGAQENLTAAIAMDGRIYPTQYVGDGDSIGVIEFLEQAVRYQTRLLGLDSLDVVAMDLHPGYSNRRMGKIIGEEYGAEIIEVQHHWAHASSLMVDSGENEMIALTLDGTGYGEDGRAWGGEVLHTTFQGFERVGHLEEIPLLGGEKAVRDIGRLVFALSELNGRRCDIFDEGEAAIFRKMMTGSLRTSSFGRILDTLSCYLGVCRNRSYDGEPAMKLEALLESGRKIHEFEVDISNGVVKTVPMFGQLFEMGGRREDLALSFVHDLLTGMLEVAFETAESSETRNVGLTGGVAYNGTISSIVKNKVLREGLNFIGHNRVPNGDGGISTGQAAIALSRI